MLRGRRGLVLGVSNARSIAWSVAKRWKKEGADVFVTYQSKRQQDTVHELARGAFDLSGPDTSLPCVACDVTKDGAFDQLFETLHGRGFCSSGDDEPKLDAVMHSIAYAPAESLRPGAFLEGATREAFMTAHAVSAYSFVDLIRHALPCLAEGASVQALSYIGAQRAVPGYNVMGPAKASLEACVRALALELGPQNIRVNCVSAGPVRTLAARGIRGFSDMHKASTDRSPLRRTPSAEEVAAVSVFLASPLAAAVTGQTVYADCGFSSGGA